MTPIHRNSMRSLWPSDPSRLASLIDPAMSTSIRRGTQTLIATAQRAFWPGVAVIKDIRGTIRKKAECGDGD